MLASDPCAACVRCLGAGISLTATAGGNTALAILLTTATNLLAVLTLPLSLPLVVSAAAAAGIFGPAAAAGERGQCALAALAAGPGSVSATGDRAAWRKPAAGALLAHGGSAHGGWANAADTLRGVLPWRGVPGPERADRDVASTNDLSRGWARARPPPCPPCNAGAGAASTSAAALLSPWLLLRQLVETVLLPTLAGALARALVPGVAAWVDGHRRAVLWTSGLCLAMVPWMQVRAARRARSNPSVPAAAALGCRKGPSWGAGAPRKRAGFG